MAVVIKEFDVIRLFGGTIPQEFNPEVDKVTITEQFVDYLQTSDNARTSGFYDIMASTMSVENIPRHYEEADKKLGRCGIRKITSTWAKENYPKAYYEVVITVLDKRNPDGEVDVFIAYI